MNLIGQLWIFNRAHDIKKIERYCETKNCGIKKSNRVYFFIFSEKLDHCMKKDLFPLDEDALPVFLRINDVNSVKWLAY